jgi:flagellar biosynthesis protein
MSAHPVPLRKAAALRYDRGQDRAPRVVASGRGPVADRLVAVAESHGVPIQHDAALAEALTRLELDREIPPELFAAVAEVIGFLYRIGRA